MTEPISTTAALVAAGMKSAMVYLPGAAGAAISLKFLGHELGFWQRVTAFSIGLTCAAFVAPAAIEYLDIKGDRVHAGIQFLVGLFALAVCRELFVEINSADLIGSIKRRIFGSNP
jgi:hypothetical protein